ncbi:MAG: HlyD family efflux transporter periplasmic adaptor subunit [Leptospiraceae bacterium]|nr:HlyD family efflux transporter periplasmic adaptor subunit [Leptospiraceae bacterium]
MIDKHVETKYKTPSLLNIVQTNKAGKMLAYIALYFFIAVIIFLIFAPWQQTASGTGRVVAYAPLDRQQFIEAPIPGRIVKWHVREGSTVKKGDLIVDISDNDPMYLERLKEEKTAVEMRIAARESRIESLKARIASINASMNNAKSAAKSRTRMSMDRLDAAYQSLEAAEAVHKTAILNLNRQKTLYKQGLASKRAVETAEMTEAKARTDMNRAKASVSAAKSETIALESDQSKVSTDGLASIEDAKASLASALSDLASAKADLPKIEASLSRQHSQSVKAPRDGTIMRLIVSQDGEMVKMGEPLSILIPDTNERAAEIWIDGNDMPLITDGREVRLQFQGWPVIQFSGWPGLSFGTFGGHVVLVDPTDNGSGKFRVLVRPDKIKDWPPGKYLRQGVRVNAWIFLNRVSMGYEIWRRFNDFPPAIPMEKESKEKKE